MLPRPPMGPLALAASPPTGPRQASGLALDSLSVFGWPQQQILRTLPTCGNCVAASLPLTLAEGVLSGRIRRGDKLLLCGMGAGVSFGGLILTY